MCKYFHLQASYGGSINIYVTEDVGGGGGGGLLQLLAPQGAAMLSHSTNGEQKKGWLLTSHTATTHAGLVHDISHRPRLPESKWQHSGPCFHNSLTMIFFLKTKP